MKKISYRLYFFTFVCMITGKRKNNSGLVLSDVEVSSDAAAAVKQQSNGQKQTFISSQSKAKADKDESVENVRQQAGQRSDHPISDHESNNNEKEPHWGYTNSKTSLNFYELGYGPERWGDYFPICNGSFQSPIPLEDSSNNVAKKFVNPLNIKIENKNSLIFGYVVNDGHSFGMKIDEKKSSVLITGGPLGTVIFKLYQFHFHFSCSNRDTGSEHSLDGLKYGAEMHLVFYNTKYESFSSAIDKPDGLTVLALFIKLGNKLNHGTFLLNRFLVDIYNAGTATYLTYGIEFYDVFPKSLIDDPHSSSYVYYKGSLTTPPCYETVQWIIFQTPIEVPRRDLEEVKKYGAKTTL